MPACVSIERVTGIEPAPAYWRYAESRSEVLRAAITLHPHTCDTKLIILNDIIDAPVLKINKTMIFCCNIWKIQMNYLFLFDENINRVVSTSRLTDEGTNGGSVYLRSQLFARKGRLGHDGAKAVNGKRGLLSCIGICRQVDMAAAYR